MIYLFTYCIRCYSKRGLASDRSLNGINAVPPLPSPPLHYNGYRESVCFGERWKWKRKWRWSLWCLRRVKLILITNLMLQSTSISLAWSQSRRRVRFSGGLIRRRAVLPLVSLKTP